MPSQGNGRGSAPIPGVYIVHAAPFYKTPHPTETLDASVLQKRNPENMARSPVALTTGLSLGRAESRTPSAPRAFDDQDDNKMFKPATPTPVEVPAIPMGPRISRVDVSESVHWKVEDGSLDHPGKRLFVNLRKLMSPFLLVLVLYGIIPANLRTLRLSLHPWRSTILWVLLVQTVGSLSVRAVFSSYRKLLHSEADSAAGVDARLLAVQSMVHVSSHMVLVLLWLEIPSIRKCRPHVENFLTLHAHMLSRHPVRRATWILARCACVFDFVGGPALMVMYMLLLPDRERLTHGLSHLLQIAFVNTVLDMFALACVFVHDLAGDLSSKLKEELSTGRMTASRLEEFRMAWLSLRQLTTDLGSTPLTGLAMVMYLLVMITLATYQSVVSYYNGYCMLFASSFILFVMGQSSLLIICDAAHRLTDVMTSGFYEPLEARSWRTLPPDLLAEYQQFLHTISCNPAEVTFAGMIVLRRPTYLSIMAAIATYLIVLFQLRMSDDDLPNQAQNTTETVLSVLREI